MERYLMGEVRVEQLDDEVLIHISTEATCFSFILEPEEARRLSAALFSKYVDMTILKQYERGM